MLDESELNKAEIGLDLFSDRSSSEIVDGLLNKHNGVASNALNELQQKIEDGYTSREILLAKQKLEDILEKSKDMSRTRQFMENILNQSSLFEDEKPQKVYPPKIDRGEDKKLNLLIDNGIPPSVLLNKKELIFKTNLGNLGSEYAKDDQSAAVSDIENKLKSPFLRASDRERLKSQLANMKSDAEKYYMFRVIDVKPEGVVTQNYHSGMKPEKVNLSFNQLYNIMNEPINAANTAKAFEYFPEGGTKDSWKTTIYGNNQMIKHNYFEWYKENKDLYDLDKYNRFEKSFLFKCNAFFGYSVKQAIHFLEAIGGLTDYMTDAQIRQAIRNTKIKVKKDESLTEDDSEETEGEVFRMKYDTRPENLQAMKDFLKDKQLNKKLFDMPFEIKVDTNNLEAGRYYKIIGTQFNPNGNLIKVKQESDGEGFGQEKDIDVNELKVALNLIGEHKYRLTSDHNIYNIQKIRDFLTDVGIDPKYIDMPFIYRPEQKTNKWAQKTNQNVYKPTEHRYVITGVPAVPEVDTLKLKEILPTGLTTDNVEMPIETVKKAIQDNPHVDYNIMVNPKNGEVIDIPLDPKLRAATYKHGVQGEFYPLTDDNVKGLLRLAQKLIGTDRKPIYVEDLVRSYETGDNDMEVKEAMKDIWNVLKINNFLQVKNVEGKLKFYYTLGDAFLRSDGTSRMVKQARHKEGQ